MFSFYANIKFVVACIKAIRDVQDTGALIAAGQKLATPERFEDSNKFLCSIPGAWDMVRARKTLPNFDIQQLAKLPESTLGYKYAQHMIQNNLDPNFYNVDFKDDISYQYYRFSKTHDLWHVLSGFGVSEPDEVALLAFTYAQTRGPGMVLIIALTFLHAVLLKPKKIEVFFKSVVKGWNLGQQAAPFYTLDWESLVNKDFEEVRSMVGLGQNALTNFPSVESFASIDSVHGVA